MLKNKASADLGECLLDGWVTRRSRGDGFGSAANDVNGFVNETVRNGADRFDTA